MGNVVIVPKEPGWSEAFRSPVGILGVYMLERTHRVEAGAKRQVHVKTGALKASIHSELFISPTGDIAGRVGSDNDHALEHHEGTPPHVIRPHNARILRFVNKAGEIVFARQTHDPGTKPNHYLTDNLPLAVL